MFLMWLCGSGKCNTISNIADFDGHRPRYDVTRRQILGGGRIAFHEALAFGVDEIAAFAARTFGDETAGAVNAGRVELHEFHILQRQAGAQHHRAAVAGLGVRAGTGMIDAAIAAGRQDGGLGAEAMQRAVVKLERDHAAAGALVVHDQVDGEELDVELGGMAQRLAIHGVQHGVAGAVGGGAGALCLALAVVHRHAAKRSLIDLAVLGARKRHTPVLEFINGLRRLAHHVFDRILVAEPVRALDGVVHMPAPVVRMHVAERQAEMPPWAATVCERVGNTLVMQAVRSPASLQPTTARSPAPPAPTTTTS